MGIPAGEWSIHEFCPFCGKKGVEVWDDARGARIACCGCGCATPWCTSHTIAWHTWCVRVKDADSEDEEEPCCDNCGLELACLNCDNIHLTKN